MISAVLADDHSIVRKGLRTLLDGEGNCRVVGEADDGLTAIDLISRLQPDVAIIDVQLPKLDGLEVARRTRQQAPETKVMPDVEIVAVPFVEVIVVLNVLPPTASMSVTLMRSAPVNGRAVSSAVVRDAGPATAGASFCGVMLTVTVPEVGGATLSFADSVMTAFVVTLLPGTNPTLASAACRLATGPE